MDRVSVVVKALNESAKIEACLRSIIEHAPPGSEIILADSLSDDDTVAKARSFPIRIVQMADRADRSCGAAAQLGFQAATGDFVLLMDGDMELEPGFVPAALAAMRADAKLAGVGGHSREMALTLEFRQRQARPGTDMQPGAVTHLSGGGLYRMTALRQVGFLANRNLHAMEEFDLGLRLRQAGWRLVRIDRDQVRHHGHTIPPHRLLAGRWRSRYLRGYGEFIRAHIGGPGLPVALWQARLFLAVIAWWAALAACAGASLLAGWPAWPAPALALALPAALLARKRGDIGSAAYSFALWNLYAAALILGVWRKPIDPRLPIAHVEVTE